MARTRKDNCFRVLEWSIDQEYGNLWKPNHPALPLLRPYKSLVRQGTQREIIEEIVRAKAEMEAKAVEAADGDGSRSSSSGHETCDAIIEVLMRTELFAKMNDVYGEQTRVDLVIKKDCGRANAAQLMNGEGCT